MFIYLDVKHEYLSVDILKLDYYIQKIQIINGLPHLPPPPLIYDLTRGCSDIVKLGEGYPWL